MNISKFGQVSCRSMLRYVVSGFAVLLLAMAIAGKAGRTDAAEMKKYKIFLSLSYVGNDWQAESTNMISAVAKSLGDKVELHAQASGPDAQKQIQQINAMVQAGADAILVYPISPTALNGAIKAACARHVVVFAFDSAVTEPCAYHLGTDQVGSAKGLAQWLADDLHGKGNVVMITGIPGTTVDTNWQDGANSVFSKYPGINVVAKVNGQWSEAGAQSELSKLLATRGWDQIDGLWVEAGCFTAAEMQLNAGIAEKDVKPCAGTVSNGFMVQMLPAGTVKGPGAYRAIGYPSAADGDPPVLGAYAFKLVIDILDGKPVPKDTVWHTKPIVNPTLCKNGLWSEMNSGCAAFDPALVPASFYSNIYNEHTPEVGLQAALFGEPEAVTK